jgi:hypothetical protein
MARLRDLRRRKEGIGGRRHDSFPDFQASRIFPRFPRAGLPAAAAVRDGRVRPVVVRVAVDPLVPAVPRRSVAVQVAFEVKL